MCSDARVAVRRGVKHFDPHLERSGLKANDIKESKIPGRCSSDARWLWIFKVTM